MKDKKKKHQEENGQPSGAVFPGAKGGVVGPEAVKPPSPKKKDKKAKKHSIDETKKQVVSSQLYTSSAHTMSSSDEVEPVTSTSNVKRVRTIFMET